MRAKDRLLCLKAYESLLLAKYFVGLSSLDNVCALSSQVLSSALVDSEQETSTNKKWKVVRRPLLDMELRRYAQSPVVPQALILHGPRGVGKRTTVEGLSSLLSVLMFFACLSKASYNLQFILQSY